MRHLALTSACLWLCLVQAQPAQSAPPTGPITIERAIELALGSHPSIRAAAHQADAARATLVGARSLPSPELLVTPVGSIDDSQATLVQPLGLATGPAGASAARARWEAASAGLVAARCDVAYRVRIAFNNLLAARSICQALAQSVEVLEQVNTAARKSLELGNAPESHVIRTRIELARARGTLRTAQGEADALEAALGEAMGLGPTPHLELAGDLALPAPIGDLAPLRAAMLKGRPDLAVVRWEMRAREADSRLARAATLPDLSLDLRQTRLRERGGTFGIGLSLPFLDWGRRNAEARSASASARSAHETLLVEEARATADLDAGIARLRAAAESVGQYEGGILADAERLSAMARTGYEEGALSYLEALDAQRTLAETRQAAIEARLAYANSRAAVDRAVGLPVLPIGDGGRER